MASFNKLHDLFVVTDSNGTKVAGPTLDKTTLDLKGTFALLVNGVDAGATSTAVTGATGAVTSGDVTLSFVSGSTTRTVTLRRSFARSGETITGINRVDVSAITDTGAYQLEFWDGYRHRRFEFFRAQ